MSLAILSAPSLPIEPVSIYEHSRIMLIVCDVADASCWCGILSRDGAWNLSRESHSKLTWVKVQMLLSQFNNESLWLALLMWPLSFTTYLRHWALSASWACMCNPRVRAHFSSKLRPIIESHQSQFGQKFRIEHLISVSINSQPLITVNQWSQQVGETKLSLQPAALILVLAEAKTQNCIQSAEWHIAKLFSSQIVENNDWHTGQHDHRD